MTFDDSFAGADAEAFKVMADTDPVTLSHPEAEAFDTTAIVYPGGSQVSVARIGGQGEVNDLQAELTDKDVREHGVASGWRLRWKGQDFRITAMVPQGSTFTAVCIALGDAREQ